MEGQEHIGVHAGTRGGSIQVRSGSAYYPMDPQAEDVREDDVAWALARAPRYGGHASRAYTVLEHMVRGCDLILWMEVAATIDGVSAALTGFGGPTWLQERRAAIALALAFAVHDAAEAYVVDVPRPLKVNLPDYRRVESRNDEVVMAALVGADSLSAVDWAQVKRVDNLMLAAERDQLMLSEEQGGLKWSNLPAWPLCRATDLAAPVWSAVDARECIAEEDALAAATSAAHVVLARHGYGLGEPFHAALGRLHEAAATHQAALLAAAWRRRLRVLRAAVSG
jgi:hypothetical protein